ncbi:hypothetical protein B0H21DRAFT_759332 [Amylocystis lapponica]|nr:hypothetical protein B0H21DRAFT_759332 [Amylocystis lapponica]
MATDLYEVLGLDRNASPEDIRKAYKRKALQTHPDRLPPNITPAEKAYSEEAFRKVNNAYEVLNDVQNRSISHSRSMGFPFDNMPGAFGSMASTFHPFASPFAGSPDANDGAQVRSYSSVSQSISQNGQWVSQSNMTRTINGRTETIHKRRDAAVSSGERYTINGIEQAAPQSNRAIAAPPPPIIADPSRGRSHQVQAQAYAYPAQVPAASYTAPPPSYTTAPAQQAPPVTSQATYPDPRAIAHSHSHSRRHGSTHGECSIPQHPTPIRAARIH